MATSDAFRGVIGRTVDESMPAWDDLRIPPEGSPNVVVVLLDDTGFAHFGCYGSPIDTPNIDRLAANGLRYTNFHVAPVCSPTRASLLTGRNHHSVGMRTVANFDTGYPNSRGAIPSTAANLAEVLRSTGYATFMVGKWHLAPGHECSAAGPFTNWPLQKGFDKYYGFLGGETDQFWPELVRDNTMVDPPRTPDEGYHLSEDLVDNAIAYLSDVRSITPERPFFLYVAFGATHAPHQSPDAFRHKYRGRFDEGWDTHRGQVFERQLDLGVVPRGTELPPRNPGVVAWDELDDRQRAFTARLQEAFAGFLDHTDAQIGRLVDHLASTGQLDNTIFLVLSDNGASQEGGAGGVFDEMKFLQGLEEDLDEAIERLDDLGGPHSHPNYPWGWAAVGNTPGKRYKQNTHGGGVRSPLVVHWPAGLRDPGALRDQFCHAIDLTPTILDLVGVEAPAVLSGVAQQPMHGASLRATLDDRAAPAPRATQYFEMFCHRGIYHDGWKAVTWHDASREGVDDDAWELYHLAADYSESHDLAAEQPDKLREMIERWWTEAGRYDALPLDPRPIWQLVRPQLRGAPTSRTTFVYRPPLAHLPVDVSPPHGPRPFAIVADVELGGDGSTGDETDGVLVNRGTINGGYALFVLGGHLVFDYNHFHRHSRVTSPMSVPRGRTQLGVRVETQALDGPGQATLTIDGDDVAHVDIPRIARTLTSLGMDIGRAIAPVCADYARPFAFPGTIHSVTFTLPDGRPPTRTELDEAARAELARQ